MTLVLTRTQTAAALDLPSVVNELADTWSHIAPGESVRRSLQAGRADAHLVAGAELAGGGSWFVVKCNLWLDGAPTGAVLLYDAETGRLDSVMDAAVVTRTRTAAFTALAVRHCAPLNLRKALIVGTGRQMPDQLAALRLSAPTCEIAVWGRDREAALIAADKHGVGFATGSLDVAVAESDVVVCVTPSRAPLVRQACVTPGTLIIALGADAPGKQELEPELILQARVIVDDVDQCLTYGELQHLDDSIARELVVGTLRQVVAGVIDARTGDRDVIVVDSTGTAAQDVAAAVLAFQRCRALGLGQEVDLQG